MNRRERKARARARKAAGSASNANHRGADPGVASGAPAKAHGDKFEALIPRGTSPRTGTDQTAPANEERHHDQRTRAKE